MVLLWVTKNLEARAGIEPAHKGFADLSLTTWVPRLGRVRHGMRMFTFRSESGRLQSGTSEWSGRRDLNSRPSPWQGDALPLSYSRLTQIRVYRAEESGSNQASGPSVTVLVSPVTRTRNGAKGLFTWRILCGLIGIVRGFTGSISDSPFSISVILHFGEGRLSAGPFSLLKRRPEDSPAN